MSEATTPLPHVVILGGGFAGLTAARRLRREPVRITLVDRRNYHLFQPLLYQVASAGLNPSDIAVPIRAIVYRQKNVTVLYAEAEAIDVAARRVELDIGPLDYDLLVVATGATHAYFGHDEWEHFAPGLKTLEDALTVRRRVLFAFEAAERDPAARDAFLTFVVVGGGPTGVELAGALSEIARHALTRDFRHIDPAQARVILVEAGDRILTTYTPASSQAAVRQLERLGVEVQVRKKVTAIDACGVSFDSERIEARTIIWAAGVAASHLGRSLGAPLDRAGRVEVTEQLTIPGHDEIFVIGDLAAVRCEGKPVPGVAPAAMQEGRYVAANLRARRRGRAVLPFRYRDKGSLATIGRSAAVAEIGRMRLWGFIAWMAWLLIHIFFLIGFRNRLLVLFEWAWSYFTFRRGARLITEVGDPPPPSSECPPA